MRTFFADAAAFRRWLTENAATAKELVVGFHTTKSGLPSITWPQSVDEALCVGWIDGVRKNVDATSYQIRFSPRKPSSHWSTVNIRRVAVLTAEGRMQAAGLAAYAQRSEARSGKASYEQPCMPELAPADQKLFRKHRAAWAFFEKQPPGYRKRVIWIVISAKQEATRQRRLAALIEASAAGQRI